MDLFKWAFLWQVKGELSFFGAFKPINFIKERVKLLNPHTFRPIEIKNERKGLFFAS